MVKKTRRLALQPLSELIAAKDELLAAEQTWRAGAQSALRSARKDAGLTQSELAEHAGVSAAYVNQVENGARTPTQSSLRKFYEALENAPEKEEKHGRGKAKEDAREARQGKAQAQS